MKCCSVCLIPALLPAPAADSAAPTAVFAAGAPSTASQTSADMHGTAAAVATTAGCCPVSCRSVVGIAWPAGEGDDLPDVVQASGEQDEALKAQTETCLSRQKGRQAGNYIGACGQWHGNNAWRQQTAPQHCGRPAEPCDVRAARLHLPRRWTWGVFCKKVCDAQKRCCDHPTQRAPLMAAHGEPGRLP